MADCRVINKAPDMDELVIRIGEWEVIVGRETGGQVNVAVVDHAEGSETSYVLGQKGESQKV